MLPDCRFLGSVLWRLVILAVMAGIAYGWNRSALRRGTVFVLLSMALGGMALGLGNHSLPSLLLAAAGVVFLCAMGIRSPIGMDKFQIVELCRKGRKIRLTAMVDTGNTLRDPITGSGVLVVGADVAGRLGISREMIRDPVTALADGKIPGARLIPYRAVGKPVGMLLMLRLDEVRLNGRVISPMVAFAPEEIGEKYGYEALVGGMV